LSGPQLGCACRTTFRLTQVAMATQPGRLKTLLLSRMLVESCRLCNAFHVQAYKMPIATGCALFRFFTERSDLGNACLCTKRGVGGQSALRQPPLWWDTCGNTEVTQKPARSLHPFHNPLLLCCICRFHKRGSRCPL